MIPSTANAPAGAPPTALEQARARRDSAGRAEAAGERERLVDEWTGYFDYVAAHRPELAGSAPEVAKTIDDAAMTLYRLSRVELSEKAIDLGLTFDGGNAPLLHHKAMLLMALNKEIDRVVPLLERAAQSDPSDKGIWATTGDAFKLLGRPNDAAEAYLRAQALDANSTQYVEKALRTVPNHPAALRMTLSLARAHEGNAPALEACEALLSVSPNDPELLFARVELRSLCGQYAQALDAVAPAREARPGDPRLALLAGRIHLALGHPLDALAEFRLAAEASERLTVPELADLAERTEPVDERAELTIRIREALLARDPRNLANLKALRMLAQKTRRFDLGITASRKILEVSPGNLEATRALAEFQLTGGHLDDGFSTYRQLMSDHPEEIGEARRAIEAARVARRTDLVAEFARRASSQDPGDLGLQVTLGEALRARGELAPALEVYEGLSKAAPNDARYWLARREILVALGRNAEVAPIDERLFDLAPARTDIAFDRATAALDAASSAAPGSPEREAQARIALRSFERAMYDPARTEPSLLGVARTARLLGDHARARAAYEEYLAKPGRDRDASVLKELGHALREAGELAAAEQAYERALAYGREDEDLLWGEVELLVALGDEPKALRYVDVLLRRSPSNVLYLRRKGQLLLRSGREAEGAWTLKAAAEKAPKDASVQVDVAKALRAAGSYPDAIEYYRAAIALDPDDRAGRLALAETLNLAGRHDEAIPILDALLHDDPNDLAGWKARSDACRALGRSGELAYSLKAILLLDPLQSTALVEKYRLHLSQGEKPEALDCLSEFLASGPPESHDPGILLEAGDLAMELGRTEEALRWYEKAQESDPSQALAIGLRRARVRLSAGRPDLALEILESAVAARPADDDPGQGAGLLRGEILTALERAPEAEAAFRKVIERDARSAPGIAGLARSLLEQGKAAEAKALLVESIPKSPPSAKLFLLLAESEGGLGQLPEAVRALEKGLEVMPASAELWSRLGEVEIALQGWERAAEAFQKAIAEGGESADLLLKAGSVAERRGRSSEALALYDRATQVAPTSKFTWSSRGLALLSQGRPDEASESFERALAIDTEFDAARQGKKVAGERSREQRVGRYAREALLLEGRLHRTVTKNDLFVTLHVPFDLLEEVLADLSRAPSIDLAKLTEEELATLESESCQLVTAALARHSDGAEQRGFSLADVAQLSPPTRTLAEMQRLFGYFKAVLEVELTPENLRLSPDVEELARRALLLPPDQRTLFQLVKTLKVGIFRARLIKVVESSGAAVHAPIPSIDLGAFSPEFATAPGSLGPSTSAGPLPSNAFDPPSEVGEAAARPSDGPAPSTGAGVGPSERPAGRPLPSTARCVGCGGLASIVHSCGAPVCAHCILEFRTCPKCHQAAYLPPPPTPSGPSHSATSTSGGHRSGAPKIPSSHHPTGRGTLETLHQVASSPKNLHKGRPPEPPARSAGPPRTEVPDPPSSSHPKIGGGPESKAEASPRPPHVKPKTDDEPRL